MIRRADTLRGERETERQRRRSENREKRGGRESLDTSSILSGAKKSLASSMRRIRANK
jgi:hypothetical protein